MTDVATIFLRIIVALFAMLLFYVAVMVGSPRPAFLNKIVTIAYYTIRLFALLFIET